MIAPGTNGKDAEISYSVFMSKVTQGGVKDVQIANNEAHGHYTDGNQFHLVVPPNNPELVKALDAHNVQVTFRDSQGANWTMLLFQFSPIVLLGVLWFIMIRQMQTGGNKALSFGKSRARLLSMQQKKVTFKDVAGVDEAKEELREIIEFLREAQKFQKLRGR